MSLDKQIKELATKELNGIVEIVRQNIGGTVKGTPLTAEEVARLVSGHKVKTTHDACVKVLAKKISDQMFASIGNDEVED